jgi:hypothetical protein
MGQMFLMLAGLMFLVAAAIFLGMHRGLRAAVAPPLIKLDQPKDTQTPEATTTPNRTEEYREPFRFMGTIKRVTLDLSGELIPDSEADMKIATARQ